MPVYIKSFQFYNVTLRNEFHKSLLVFMKTIFKRGSTRKVKVHEADSWCPFLFGPSLYSACSFGTMGLASRWDLSGLSPLAPPSLLSRPFDGDLLLSRLLERLFLSRLLDLDRLLFSRTGDLLL